MPKPNTTDLHVSQLLSNVSLAYSQQPNSFVADKVFPILPVDKQINKIAVYSKADWLRDDATMRKPPAVVEEGGYTGTTSAYECERYEHAKVVTDEERAEADDAFAADKAATEYVTQKALIKREVRFAAIAMVSGGWGSNYSTPGNLWSDMTAGDPLSDAATAHAAIEDGTGMPANVAVMGAAVFRQLRKHPQLHAWFSSPSARGPLSEEQVAMALGVERIVVGRAVKNTAVENASASMANIIGKHCLFLHVPKAAGMFTPSAGYTLAWKGFGPSGVRIKKYRVEEKEGDKIEGGICQVPKIIATDLGYLFVSAVS